VGKDTKGKLKVLGYLTKENPYQVGIEVKAGIKTQPQNFH